MAVVLRGHQEALLLQQLHNDAPRLLGRLAGQHLQDPGWHIGDVGKDVGLVVQYPDARQVRRLAQSRFIIVEIMGRRDLHCAGAELQVHQDRVAHDRDPAARERQGNGPSDQVLVPGVKGVDSHGRIAQHGLGPRRCHGKPDVPVVAQGIGDMIELAFFVLVLDLDVRQGRMAAGAPVDQPLAAVDEALFVEPDKDLAHGLGQAFIHREALALPVAGGAELLELADDAPAVLLLPLPDLPDECFPAQRVAVDLLRRELALHHVLRGDACVVRAGKPEGAVAAHPAPADQDVLERCVQRVAHVERSRYVRRGNDNRIGPAPCVGRGMKIALLFPLAVPCVLNDARLVGLAQLPVGHENPFQRGRAWFAEATGFA